MEKTLSGIILNDRRGTYEVNVSVPSHDKSASCNTFTVVKIEIISHISKEEAKRVAEDMKKQGIPVEEKLDS